MTRAVHAKAYVFLTKNVASAKGVSVLPTKVKGTQMWTNPMPHRLFFGACSAFTHVMACTLAESPSDPLHRKLRQLRCLRRRFDCYRVERTSSRAGIAPAEVQRLSRRTFSPTRRRILFRSTVVDIAESLVWN